MSKPVVRPNGDGTFTQVAARDGLVSLATRLGTSEDKAHTTSYQPRVMQNHELEAAFRSSWIAKKAVKIPALDATRRWRQWSGDAAERIAGVEARPRIQLQKKVYQTLWMGRLYGGAAIFVGTDVPPDRFGEPLDTEREELRYLTVLPRSKLTAGPLRDDITDEFFGLPEHFQLVNNSQLIYIHPSRLVRHVGEELPNWGTSEFRSGWGDSLLQSILDACRNLDSTMANIAALVFDAKTDVIKIPELTENITDKRFEQALLERFSVARMLKGNHGILMLDGDEDYDSKTYNFGGLDTIADRFMQVASGAADIPMTRLLGMSPAGMNSTGESDLLNYYDRISSLQRTEVEPEMARLDRMIVRAADRDPDEESFVWLPLRQLTEQQKSESQKRSAESLEALVRAEIYDKDQLAEIGSSLFADLDIEVPRTAAETPHAPGQKRTPGDTDELR